MVFLTPITTVLVDGEFAAGDGGRTTDFKCSAIVCRQVDFTTIHDEIGYARIGICGTLIGNAMVAAPGI